MPAVLLARPSHPISFTPLARPPEGSVPAGKEEGSPSPVATPSAHQKQETRVSSPILPTAVGPGYRDGGGALAPGSQGDTYYAHGHPEGSYITLNEQRGV